MARRTLINDPYEPFVPERCDLSGNKIIFHSLADAQRAARMAYYDYGAEVEPYPDPVCNHWHLTSKGQ